MKWLDHRSRPDYRAYNFTRNAVASINRGLFQAGGSAYSPPPGILLAYEQYLIHTSSAAYIGDGFGHWGVARGAEKRHGLPNMRIIQDVYSYAAELVENYPSATESGWGIVDRTDVTAEDCSDGVSFNPFGYTQRLTGLTWWESPDDPYGASLELTAANYYARGHGIARADGTGDYYCDLFGIAPGPGLENVGQENAARWLRRPYTYPVASPSANFVGGLAGEYDPGFDVWAHANPSAYVRIAAGQAFALPYFLRGREATVTAARMELQFTNLERYTSTVTTTITDEETGARTTDGTSSTTLENIGIALMGGRRVGTRYEWDALANTTGGTGAANNWCVIDATSIINAMLSGKGTYHAFAIVPSPAVEAMESADSVGYLKKLMPQFTFGYWDNGSATPTMNEAGTPPEGTYYEESSGEYVTWDSVTLGNVDISFDPLLGEDGQVVLPGVSFPRMD